MRDLSNYGYGFHGWQAHMRSIVEALGGGDNMFKAVSKEFQDALSREQTRYAAKYRYPCWTEASEKDFDSCRTWLDHSMSSAPKGPVLAAAPFNGVVLELREDRVDLHGGDYYLMIGLVSHSPGVYDSRARGPVDKWSPFITDSAKLAASGSRYTSDASSVTVRSASAGTGSLRKLVEKHFKVSFTNLTEIAA